MSRRTITLLTACCDRPAFRRLGTATATVDQLEWGNLGLLRICLFPLACVTDEGEAFLLGLLGSEAVALAVLPDVALVAGHTVATVIKILAVHATHRAVESPLTFFLFQLLELLLVLLLLRQALTLGDALSICRRIALGTL